MVWQLVSCICLITLFLSLLFNGWVLVGPRNVRRRPSVLDMQEAGGSVVSFWYC